MEILYKNYERMLQKISWYYAKKWNLEFEDVFGESTVIFAETLARYQDDISSFSTYLYHRLKKLSQYCLYQVSNQTKKRYIPIILPLDDDIKFLQKFSLLTFPDKKDSKELLDYILSRSWEFQKKSCYIHHAIKPYKKPTYEYFHNVKNWSMGKFEKVWKDLEKWFRENKEEI